ncbi:MAG TPA: formylglycine-generating enzyme family protein [Candidatus Hydrogenedentes bacterium]|nr:formylglycine-generating enzyme family protein [Candidatus Hydrogenedentota bacterium]HPJ99944.1 formylglycine-generating enzyme family protein [Candidatus Hydrogenedentota bacterium]
MRRMHLFFAVGLVWVVMTGAAADPVVSDVTAAQRTDGSGLVDVYYTLTGTTPTIRIDLAFSNDGGVTWDIIPSANTVTGDVGDGISNGSDRHIVWDAARDRPDVYWPDTRARVRAVDIGQSTTFMLPGGVKLDMVRIPAGTFQMGAPQGLDPYSHSEQRPVHTVTIGEDFFMGRYEVTYRQWYAVMKDYFAWQTAWDTPEGPDYPVAWVMWDDAQEFIARLNTMGIGTFRLPTEAEWEYACRAGSGTLWHFGDDEAMLTHYAWYMDNNATGGTKPVGQKLPNPLGLYDMHGNVIEWVQDMWHEDYTGAPTDGSAWEEEPANPTYVSRVTRGGSYSDFPHFCRSAFRLGFTHYYRGSICGFRVVRTQ